MTQKRKTSKRDSMKETEFKTDYLAMRSGRPHLRGDVAIAKEKHKIHQNKTNPTNLHTPLRCLFHKPSQAADWEQQFSKQELSKIGGESAHEKGTWMAQTWTSSISSAVPPEAVDHTGTRLNMIKLQQWNEIIAHSVLQNKAHELKHPLQRLSDQVYLHSSWMAPAHPLFRAKKKSIFKDHGRAGKSFRNINIICKLLSSVHLSMQVQKQI